MKMLSAVVLLAVALSAEAGAPQLDRSVTYQGRLMDGGAPAHGFKTVTVIGFEGLVVEALRDLRAEKDAEIPGCARRTSNCGPSSIRYGRPSSRSASTWWLSARPDNNCGHVAPPRALLRFHMRRSGSEGTCPRAAARLRPFVEADGTWLDAEE